MERLGNATANKTMEDRSFSISMENGEQYFIFWRELLQQRMPNGCDFMVQAHSGHYAKDQDHLIVLGRPFFKNFQTFFDYEDLKLWIGFQNQTGEVKSFVKLLDYPVPPAIDDTPVDPVTPPSGKNYTVLYVVIGIGSTFAVILVILCVCLLQKRRR